MCIPFSHKFAEHHDNVSSSSSDSSDDHHVGQEVGEEPVEFQQIKLLLGEFEKYLEEEGANRKNVTLKLIKETRTSHEDLSNLSR